MSDYLQIFKNLNIDGEYSRTSHYLEHCDSKTSTASTFYQLENAGEEMTKVRAVARILSNKQYELWKTREKNKSKFTKHKCFTQLLISMSAEIIVAKYLSDITGYDCDRFYPEWFHLSLDEIKKKKGAFSADIFLDDNTEIQVKCKRKSDPGIILQNKCGRKYDGHRSNILSGNVAPNYFLCSVEYSHPTRDEHLYQIKYIVRTVDVYNNKHMLLDQPRNGNKNKKQLTDSKLMNLMGMKFFRPKARQYVPNDDEFPALVSEKPFKSPLDYKNFLVEQRDTIIRGTKKIVDQVCEKKIDYVNDIKWGDLAMDEDEV